MMLCWRNGVDFMLVLGGWRVESLSLVSQLLGADKSCVFGTTRLLLLCNNLLPPPHLREGKCGGEKGMSVLASHTCKRQIRDRAMAKALLLLLALHNSEIWGWRRVGSTIPVEAEHTTSSYRFCIPEGRRDVRVVLGYI